MVGLILLIAAGLVIGWALDHPAAWAVVLLPVAFALAAGDDVDIVVAILGIVLTALAVLAGRALARRRPPPDEGDERDESDERDEADERYESDERDEADERRERRERDERDEGSVTRRAP